MSYTEFFGRRPASTWRVGMLRRAAEHFTGVRPRLKATKEQLTQALGLIAEEQSLTERDGYDTWAALRRGGELPLRRRTVDSVNSRRIHQLLIPSRRYVTFLETHTYTPALPRQTVTPNARTRPVPSLILQA